MLNVQIHSLDVARYLAILLRLSLLTFLMPPFNNARFPAPAKVLFVLALATLLFPLLRDKVAPISFDTGSLICVVGSEILLALLMSLSVLIVMGAVEFAGELISYQAGLSMAQVVDPQSDFQVSIVSNLLELFAILLLFSFNGHHVILKTIVDSFQVLPVGQFLPGVATIDRLILATGQIFVFAIKLSAPVLIVLFALQVGLGVISKFVPNINILVTSLPVTIILGLLFIGFTLPFWSEAIAHSFQLALSLMQNLVQLQSSTP